MEYADVLWSDPILSDVFSNHGENGKRISTRIFAEYNFWLQIAV